MGAAFLGAYVESTAIGFDFSPLGQLPGTACWIA